MAKDFDATLSDAVDLAAGAAQTPGAAAARIRGRKRTVHKRVALSATSCVLLAAVSTAAFTFSSSHGDATPQLPAATTGPGPTTAASPTPDTVPGSAGSSADSATTAPSTSVSSTPSTSASSTPTATSGGSATVPAAPSTTWLTPSQVPYDNLMNWRALTPTHCTGSLVFKANYSGCQMQTPLGTAHTAQKLDAAVFSSTGVPSGNGVWAPPLGFQDFFTYANAADAQAAFQTCTQGLLAEDAQLDVAIDPVTNRPIVSTTTVTAQSTGSMAIYHRMRDDNGAPGLVNGEGSSDSDVHFYFAVKGNILEVLEVMGGVSISNTSDDKAILATVANALT